MNKKKPAKMRATSLPSQSPSAMPTTDATEVTCAELPSAGTTTMIPKVASR